MPLHLKGLNHGLLAEEQAILRTTLYGKYGQIPPKQKHDWIMNGGLGRFWWEVN